MRAVFACATWILSFGACSAPTDSEVTGGEQLLRADERFENVGSLEWFHRGGWTPPFVCSVSGEPVRCDTLRVPPSDDRSTEVPDPSISGRAEIVTVRDFLEEVVYDAYHWRSADGAQLKIYRDTSANDVYINIAGSTTDLLNEDLNSLQENCSSERDEYPGTGYIEFVRQSLLHAFSSGMVDSGSRVFFTGHSQGGNVAQLVAASLSTEVTGGVESRWYRRIPWAEVRRSMEARGIRVAGVIATGSRPLGDIVLAERDAEGGAVNALIVNALTDPVAYLRRGGETFHALTSQRTEHQVTDIGSGYLTSNQPPDLVAINDTRHRHGRWRTTVPFSTITGHHNALLAAQSTIYFDPQQPGPPRRVGTDVHGQSYLDPRVGNVDRVLRTPVALPDFVSIHPPLARVVPGVPRVGARVDVRANDWIPNGQESNLQVVEAVVLDRSTLELSFAGLTDGGDRRLPRCEVIPDQRGRFRPSSIAVLEENDGALRRITGDGFARHLAQCVGVARVTPNGQIEVVPGDFNVGRGDLPRMQSVEHRPAGARYRYRLREPGIVDVAYVLADVLDRVREPGDRNPTWGHLRAHVVRHGSTSLAYPTTARTVAPFGRVRVDSFGRESSPSPQTRAWLGVTDAPQWVYPAHAPVSHYLPNRLPHQSTLRTGMRLSYVGGYGYDCRANAISDTPGIRLNDEAAGYDRETGVLIECPPPGTDFGGAYDQIHRGRDGIPDHLWVEPEDPSDPGDQDPDSSYVPGTFIDPSERDQVLRSIREWTRSGADERVSPRWDESFKLSRHYLSCMPCESPRRWDQENDECLCPLEDQVWDGTTCCGAAAVCDSEDPDDAPDPDPPPPPPPPPQPPVCPPDNCGWWCENRVEDSNGCIVCVCIGG